jgi:phosphoglycolate phosphatase
VFIVSDCAHVFLARIVLFPRSVVNSCNKNYPVHVAALRYKAVLFDLDGTLLDTLDDLGDSVNAVLTRLGHPAHEMPKFKYFVGDGVANLVRRSLPEPLVGDDTVVEAVTLLVRSEYGKRWKDKTHAYPGMPELLTDLGARGVKLAVLSNKPHPATLEVVGHFLAQWHFDVVLGARPGVPIKPDPGAALEACSLLGVDPKDVLYLGDTNTDMQTAVGAGLFPVGALWGFRTADELRASGAQALVAHPREVLDLI